jgi:hypothetical protein
MQLIRSFSQYLRFFLMILRYGKLLHSGNDFNQDRKDQLKNLSAFVAPKNPKPFDRLLLLPSVLSRNSFFRNLISQGAFAKRNLLAHGGHLHIPFLNVSYVRIPKAANTSLSWAVLQAIYPSLKEKELAPREINFLTDANLRQEITFQDSGDIFFTVVRNPLARLVSVYRDFFENKGHLFIYEDYLFGLLKKNISFQEFVQRIDLIPVWLLDQHLRPQSSFLEIYKRKGNPVVALKLEKAGEVDSFLSIYGMSMPYLNGSSALYDYRSYYTAETLRIVYRIYQKDIKSFGYQEEYALLEKRVKNATKGQSEQAF